MPENQGDGKVKNNWKRWGSCALAMILTTTQVMPSASAAWGAESVEEEQTEVIWESVMMPDEALPIEEGTEPAGDAETDGVLIRDEADEETGDELIALEAESSREERTWQEEMILSGISLDAGTLKGMEFPGMRLILSADHADQVLDQEHILSACDDLYLLQYDNPADIRTAYAYYAGAAEKGLIHFVDTDRPVFAAEKMPDGLEVTWGEEVVDSEEEMEAEDNPVAYLAEALEKSSPLPQKHVIALIDTGVNDRTGVVDAVSLIDEDPGDDSGHGSKMQQTILQQYPDAAILSIKALDAQGQGHVSSVCSALHYAMEAGANIINLSLYAYKTTENSAIAALIREAVGQGIQVVGAAGNDSRPVRYYVPGSIEEALIVGACDENGVKLPSSNYGETVDYNVYAGSTSEAAAKMSAFLAQYWPQSREEYHANENQLIFTTDYDGASEDITEAGSEEESEEAAKVNWDMFRAALNMESIPKFKGTLYYTSTPAMLKLETTKYSNGSVPASTLKHASFVSESEGSTLAFCLVPSKNAPSTQNTQDVTVMEIGSISELSKANRARLVKAMFYLYGGRGYVQGLGGMEDLMESYGAKSNDSKYVLSHYIMAYIYCSNADNGKWNVSSIGSPTAFNAAGEAMLKDFVKKLDALDDPSSVKVSVSKTSIAANEIQVSGEVRTSPKISYESSVEANTVSFTVPSDWNDTTLMVVSTKGEERQYGSGKKAVIHPGESFYLVRTGSSTTKTTINLKPKYFKDFKAYIAYFSRQILQPISLTYSTSTSLTVNISWPESEKPAYALLEKRSAVPQLSAGNRCYSLEGAAFKLYREDGSALSGAEYDLITGPEEDTGEKTADGRSIMRASTNVLSVLPGTYYAEEIRAPKGYARNTERIKVTVTRDNTEQNPARITVQDVPKADPFGVSIVKVSDQGEHAPSLEGAEFTIAYYDAYYDTAEQIEASGDRPLRTWTVTTKKMTAGDQVSYVADLDQNAGGDPFYFDTDGNISLPLGTMVIRETKAPKHYGLDNAQVKAGNAGDDAYGAFPFVTQIREDETGTARIASRNELSKEVARVREPQILMTSKASGSASGSGFVIAGEKAEISDTIQIRALSEKREYVLKGRLIDEKDGSILARAESKPFKGQKGAVSVTLTFTDVDVSRQVGRSVLAECELYETQDRSTVIAEHVAADMSEEEKDHQRIYIAQIGTKVQADETKDQYAAAGEDVLLTDTVSYRGLRPGKTYRMTGQIVRKNGDGGETPYSSAEAFMYDPQSQKAPQESRVDYVEFTPKKSDGTVAVHFCLNSREYAGEQLVVFEKLYLTEHSSETKKETQIEIARHEDIDDEGQTLYVSRIGTQASSMKTGDHTGEAYENLVIRDRVSYENLNPEKTYYLRGEVVDQETGEAVDYRMVSEQGEEISYVTFTPEKDSKTGEVQAFFALNGEPYRGRSLVVYETVSEDAEGKVILAQHRDLKDEGQTIRLPQVYTKAEDVKTKKNHALADKEAILVDTVRYVNLVPGYTYTVKGTLHNRLNGEVIPSQMVDENGKDIQEYAFTIPEDAPKNASGGVDGEVKIRLRYDAAKAAGTSGVVFEKLYHDIEVAAHEDLEDEDQRIYIPKIKTRAKGKDTGDNETKVSKNMKIVDTVSYEGLQPGATYTLKGTLMDKSSGKPIRVGGKNVTAKKTFTPKTDKGEVKLTFTFDGTKLSSKVLVVFEDLYLKGTTEKVATHSDIKDKAQSITLRREEPQGSGGTSEKTGGSSGAVKTGDTQPVPLFTLLALISLVAALWIMQRKRRMI